MMVFRRRHPTRLRRLTEHVTTPMAPDMLEALQKECEKLDMSVAAYVRMVLSESLNLVKEVEA